MISVKSRKKEATKLAGITKKELPVLSTEDQEIKQNCGKLWKKKR